MSETKLIYHAGKQTEAAQRVLGKLQAAGYRHKPNTEEKL